MEPHAAHAVGAAGGASGGGDATATDTAAPGVLLAAEPPAVIGIMSVAAPLLAAWMAVRCALEGVRRRQWPGLQAQRADCRTGIVVAIQDMHDAGNWPLFPRISRH